MNFPLNVNFNLRQTKPANVETPINAIVRFNNKRIVLSKIQKVQPRFWKDGRPTQHIANVNSHKISSDLLEAERTIREVFKEYTDRYNAFPSDLKAFQELLRKRVFKISPKVEKPTYITLLDYLTGFIIRCENGTRGSGKDNRPMSENTIKIYRTMARNLKMFMDAGYSANLDQMNLEFYEDYKSFLTLNLEYGANTVSKHLRSLKAVLNDAREEGLTNALFTGRRYKVENEKVTNIYLDQNELDLIFNLDLSKRETTLGVARDLFLLGANSALRFGDWHKLDPRKLDEDIIEVKTQKTNRTVAVPINKMIKDIFRKYEQTETGLPPKMTNQELNRYIKVICKEVGLNELILIEKTVGGKKISEYIPKHKLVSSHSARRSAATNMYKAGVPSLSIMAITGHTTESSFMKYIVLSNKEHARKVLEITRHNHLKIAGGF